MNAFVRLASVLVILCCMGGLQTAHAAGDYSAILHWGDPMLGGNNAPSALNPSHPYKLIGPQWYDGGELYVNSKPDFRKIAPAVSKTNPTAYTGVFFLDEAGFIWYTGAAPSTKGLAVEEYFGNVVKLDVPDYGEGWTILDIAYGGALLADSNIPQLYILIRNGTNGEYQVLKSEFEFPFVFSIFASFDDYPSNLYCNPFWCNILNASGVPLMWGTDPVSSVGRAHLLPAAHVDFPTKPTDFDSSRSASLIGYGAEHMMAKIGDNEVFLWGSNRFQQLGTADVSDTFSYLDFGPDSSVYDLACGAYHSLVLEYDGTLFQFGRNNRGQTLNTTSAFSSSYFSYYSDNVFAWGDTSFLSSNGDQMIAAWGSNTVPLGPDEEENSEPSPTGFLGTDSDLLWTDQFLSVDISDPDVVQTFYTYWTYYVAPVHNCKIGCAIFSVISRVADPPVDEPLPRYFNPSNYPVSVITFGMEWNSGGLLSRDLYSGSAPPADLVEMPIDVNFTSVSVNLQLASFVDTSGHVWYWGSPRSSESGTAEFPSVPWDSSSRVISDLLMDVTPSSPSYDFYGDLTFYNGNDSTVYRKFALGTFKSVSVDEHDSISTHGVSSERFNSSIGAEAVEELVTGATHAIAILSNGSVVTWEMEALVAPLPHLGRVIVDAGEGSTPFVLDFKARLVAAGDKISVVLMADTAFNPTLYAFGSNIDYLVTSPSTSDAPVQFSDLAGIEASGITKIALGQDHFLALASGAAYRWASSNFPGAPELGPTQLASATQLGSEIADIAAFLTLDYLLTDSGYVYAVGFAPQIADLYPFGTSQTFESAVPVQIPVNVISGWFYKVTKLMNSLSRTNVTRALAPLLLIAEPTGLFAYNLPPWELYSFGNSKSLGAGLSLGLAQTQSREYVLSKMFPNAVPEQTPCQSDLNKVDVLLGLDFGAFLCPNGDLYGWGRLHHTAQQTIQTSPIRLASGIASAAVWEFGIATVNTNGNIGFVGTAPAEYLDLAPSLFTGYGISSINCGPGHCVVLRTQTGSSATYPLILQQWSLGWELTNREVRKALVTLRMPEQEAVFHYLLQSSQGIASFAITNATGTAPEPIPIPASNPLASLSDIGLVAQFECSGVHCVVLLAANPGETWGTVYGWGSNSYGQLANFTGDYAWEPLALLGQEFDDTILSVAAVGLNTFALDSSGTLYFWGIYNREVDWIDPNFIPGSNPAWLSFGASQTWSTPWFFGATSVPKVVYSSSMMVPVVSQAKRDASGIVAQDALLPIASWEHSTEFRGFALISLPSPSDLCGPLPIDGFNVTAKCYILDGFPTWLFAGDLVSDGQPITITGDLYVNGSVTANGGLTIKAGTDGKVPKVSMAGCLNITSSISVDFSHLSAKELEALSKTTPAAQTVLITSCAVDGDVNSLISAMLPSDKCRKATADLSLQDVPPQKPYRQGFTQITAVFKVGSSKCNRAWVIAVSVVCAVVGAGVIAFMVAITVSPELRKILTPYRRGRL